MCHTDMYKASGADPSGYAPTVLGHEGAGVVERVGSGVTSVEPGDRVVTLFSPQCRKCIHCLDPRTNLCLAIRDQQNRGLLPDGTTRLSRGGESIRHFMGTSTFAQYTVMPEIALARVSPRRSPPDHRRSSPRQPVDLYETPGTVRVLGDKVRQPRGWLDHVQYPLGQTAVQRTDNCLTLAHCFAVGTTAQPKGHAAVSFQLALGSEAERGECATHGLHGLRWPAQRHNFTAQLTSGPLHLTQPR
jgi:hypothetical protein